MGKIKKQIKKNSKALAIRTLTPSPFKQNQLLFILQKTPQNHIYHRPAKGGGEWDYVTGAYVKKTLNYIFGWKWNFEIKEHGIENKLVWVLGKLTINNQKGLPLIIKEQFGRADIKFKKGTDEKLDFGNDLKAAATDALKKCASELGIASDVYAQEEFKEIQKVDKEFVPPEEESLIAPIKTEAIQLGLDPKVEELKGMLKGQNNEEKIKDLEKKTGIKIKDFKITESHAIRLIGELLNHTVKQ